MGVEEAHHPHAMAAPVMGAHGARAVSKVAMVNAEDIFLWPDGFWCFREEFSPQFLRGEDYRVIPYRCDEWTSLAGAD